MCVLSVFNALGLPALALGSDGREDDHRIYSTHLCGFGGPVPPERVPSGFRER